MDDAQKWLIGEHCAKLWQIVAPKLGHFESADGQQVDWAQAINFVPDTDMTINLADLDNAMLTYEKINTELLKQNGIISDKGDIDAAKLSIEATNYAQNRGTLGV